MPRLARRLIAAASLLCAASGGRAQFHDPFDEPALNGWFTMTGDGAATLEFVPHGGFARMRVDATRDRHNVWWTIIKRDVSAFLDLEKLRDPAYELRVEARVRPSHAPRRVNFMLNTQRTTNFHEHLREYDLPDTNGWHTISMTTRGFDAAPGDTVYVQLGVTDWGPGRYHLDVDYYRADVVRRADAAPDVGEPLPYHPPVREPATFSEHLPVTHDSVVHADFPEVNFNDWRVTEPGGPARVLTVTANQAAILRWDLTRFRGRRAEGAGVLELTTSSVAQGGNYVEPFGEDLGVEFGRIRVIEILGGDPAWDQATVTYARLLRGEDPAEVFNSQMVFDLEIATQPREQKPRHAAPPGAAAAARRPHERPDPAPARRAGRLDVQRGRHRRPRPRAALQPGRRLGAALGVGAAPATADGGRPGDATRRRRRGIASALAGRARPGRP